jgi:hypothetical protein
LWPALFVLQTQILQDRHINHDKLSVEILLEKASKQICQQQINFLHLNISENNIAVYLPRSVGA